MSQRFEIYFLQIGIDQDHVHFLVQSIPTMSVSKTVNLIKGNLSREIFLIFPKMKDTHWGGAFWTAGYYASTVSKFGGEKIIIRYIEDQGKNNKTYKLNSNYKEIYKDLSFNLFEELGVS